ncbi:MAG: helix-turn-helix transcriptional regulator [Lachnospiraceae bacterium]|nr:helix-turn-helix transcriptional regulator [Lachnospiraceae bacterium]
MEESLNSMYVIVGHNIDYFLKEKGLSQENLGAELGISQGMVSQYKTASKHPNLARIAAMSNFFQVPLEQFMFKDFMEEYERKKCEIAGERVVHAGPIDKIKNCTYNCYFVKEKLSKDKVTVITSIDRFILKVGTSITSHSAEAELLFAGDERRYQTVVHLDEKYAYIVVHEYERDFFFYMSFYYYRDSNNPRYSGGMGMIQKLDPYKLPICQFCVVSKCKIAEGKKDELFRYLEVKDEKKSLNKRSFSSKSIMRLTKSMDASLFDWLMRNKYT